MRGSHIFKWNTDTYIISANWANASDKVLVNGRHHGSVGEYKNNPKNAARSIIEMCCESDGLNVEDEEIKSMIETSIKRMAK